MVRFRSSFPSWVDRADKYRSGCANFCSARRAVRCAARSGARFGLRCEGESTRGAAAGEHELARSDAFDFKRRLKIYYRNKERIQQKPLHYCTGCDGGDLLLVDFGEFFEQECLYAYISVPRYRVLKRSVLFGSNCVQYDFPTTERIFIHNRLGRLPVAASFLAAICVHLISSLLCTARIYLHEQW